MLRVIQNNWNRLMALKSYLVISVILTVVSMSAAIYLTNKTELKGTIAVVIENSKDKQVDTTFLEGAKGMFQFEIKDQAPDMSQLVQSRFDAIVKFKVDGSFDVTTLKNDEFKNALTDFLNQKSITSDSFGPTRKVGTNIIGYMLMFLLVQGVLYARLFAEDKEKRMVERVAMSPISFVGYIVGHGLFIFLLTVIPSFVVVSVASLLGMNVGFSLSQYLLLLAVASLLSTAFAMCLNSFFCVADTANMVGSSIIILTCILAGSFYSFTKESSLFDKIIHILPQKDFMNYVNAMEKGTVTNSILIQLTYVIGISIVFFLVAVLKTRISYVRRK